MKVRQNHNRLCLIFTIDQLTEVKKSIKRHKKIEKTLKEINTEISQLIKALGSRIHDILEFKDYKPVKNVDYKDYTMYMSHFKGTN